MEIVLCKAHWSYTWRKVWQMFGMLGSKSPPTENGTQSGGQIFLTRLQVQLSLYSTWVRLLLINASRPLLSLRLRCSAWLPPSPPDWDGSNGGGGEAPPPPPRPGDVGGVRRGGQPPLQAGRRRAALRQQGRPFPQPQVRPSVRLSIFLISIFPVPIPTTNLYEYQFNL